jgi:Zinc dependent phospholipase C
VATVDLSALRDQPWVFLSGDGMFSGPTNNSFVAPASSRLCIFSTRSSLKAILLIVILVVAGARTVRAYAILAHEAIIDLAWDGSIKPLLLKRFPHATPEELKQAHAYAYGGAIIQDMGYYPFGSKFFSDMTHYVRSADFIQALLRDSQDLNEYAFALGSVAHYAADNVGHNLATNRAVPLLYPKLRRKYGDYVTYEQNPVDHLKTEFGFDVLQVARGHYAPEDYHDDIGFQVSKPLLERAFRDTYSLELKSVFSDLDLAIGTYRRSVGVIIPKMTQVAWKLKKNEITKADPTMTRQRFRYHLSHAQYHKEWGRQHIEPGFGTTILAFLIRIVPKIWVFRALSFRTPTPETEKMFVASFDAALKKYQELLAQKGKTGRIEMVNSNLDTGSVTTPGDYSLADKSYAELLDRLAKNHFQQVAPEIREAILTYYSNLNAPFATKKKKKDWARVLKELDELKTVTPSSASTPSDSSAKFPE